jgi:hypothetical protein
MQAINYYQPWLRPFLGKKKTELPDGVKSYYYYSFEDGLWDLLSNKFPRGNKLIFLIPDFYCLDVIENIKARGHRVIFYPLDKDLQIAPKLFETFISKYRPDIVIVFHACGITSQVNLVQNCLVIEDCVHRLVNPAKIKPANDRHIMMDSLRKVSPLPGSRMFGTGKALSFSQAKNSYLNLYSIESLFYYIIFRFLLKIGCVTKSSTLIKKAHELTLKKHDDIIGDSRLSYRGMGIFKGLINRINYTKLEQVKDWQVKSYIKNFQKIFSGKVFYRITIPESDYKYLHVYPLGFRTKPNKKVEELLQSKGIVVWFKFPDCPWSGSKGVLFLPLGPHISGDQISFTAKILVDLKG